MATGFQVVFDCAEPEKVGRFWAEALGYVEQPPPDGFATWDEFLERMSVPRERWDDGYAVVDPDGVHPRLFFQRVPEPKTVKNRVHLDINIASRRMPIEERRAKVDAEVERLQSTGATRLYEMEEDGGYFVTMADPEGNEFCVH